MEKIIEHDGFVEVCGVSDFDLTKTFECGQCFRWESVSDGVFSGVAYGKACVVSSCGDSIFISGTLENYRNIWRGYFDISRDYPKIRADISVDSYLSLASESGRGIRILSQEPFETLISFIISQCNNIPRIKRNISDLCRLFGNAFEYSGTTYYTFPDPAVLGSLTVSDLLPVRVGYRATYIISAARAVASGELNLEALKLLSYRDALKRLMGLCGVGVKVANCVLLFSLGFFDAFPEDVWIKRALKARYPDGFDLKVLSPYAGLAQQYIYHYERNVSSM